MTNEKKLIEKSWLLWRSTEDILGDEDFALTFEMFLTLANHYEVLLNLDDLDAFMSDLNTIKNFSDMVSFTEAFEKYLK